LFHANFFRIMMSTVVKTIVTHNYAQWLHAIGTQKSVWGRRFSKVTCFKRHF